MPSSPLSIRRATAGDRAVLERLWLMFRHDLSEFRSVLPSPDGTFRSDRLTEALADADRAAYLLMTGEHPVGLALIRGLTGAEHVLSEFFVVRGVRRGGLGLRAVEGLVSGYPGRWEVAFQDDNEVAARFWRRVARHLAGDTWSEERRPVPGREDLPPDVWITFEVPNGTS
jgi:predicted acetyltransferase